MVMLGTRPPGRDVLSLNAFNTRAGGSSIPRNQCYQVTKPDLKRKFTCVLIYSYSRTPIAQTPLESWKYIPDRGSLS